MSEDSISTSKSVMERPAKRLRGSQLIQQAIESAKDMKIAPKPIVSVPELRPVGKPLDSEIYAFLTQIRRGIHGLINDEDRLSISKNQASIEVEARIGLITSRGINVRATPTIPGSGALSRDMQEMKIANYEFVGGVSSPSFNAISSCAGELFNVQAPVYQKDSAIKSSEVRTSDTVYTYDGGLRIVIPDDSKDNIPLIRRETKEQKVTMNFQLPAALYDLRINVSVEKSHPLENGDGEEFSVPGNWTSKRRRRRSTWQSQRDNIHWRLDISIIDVTEQHHGGIYETHQVLEVELELLPRVQSQWLNEADETQADLMTKYLARALTALLDHINPLEPPSLITNPRPETRLNVAVAARRKCEMLKRLGKIGGDNEGFPGAMPVNMCRSHIPVVQGSDYFISEKTDGVRYLFVVVEVDDIGACVLVDRKMNCFSVEGGNVLASIFEDGTVLDGELVQRKSTSKQGEVQIEATFMAFDMLSLRGNALLTHKFSQRFQLVANHITSAYKSQVEAGSLRDVPHLKYAQKRFFSRTQAGDLLNCVVSTPGVRSERLYKDARDGRTHKTDGVIFQPDEPYVVGTHASLLKWKWIDVASVDLRVAISEGSIKLYTEAHGGVSVDITKVVDLASHDKARLQADMRATQLTIAEVAHDHSTGVWVYLGLRPDKDRPNFILTVMSTLVELAEGISEEELVYRMVASNVLEDGWDKHSKKMARELKDWQLQAQRNKGSKG